VQTQIQALQVLIINPDVENPLGNVNAAALEPCPGLIVSETFYLSDDDDTIEKYIVILMMNDEDLAVNIRLLNKVFAEKSEESPVLVFLGSTQANPLHRLSELDISYPNAMFWLPQITESSIQKAVALGIGFFFIGRKKNLILM